MKTIYLLVVLCPLAGAIGAGFFGKLLGRAFAHSITIAGVATSFILSCIVFQDVMAGNQFNGALYTWTVTEGINLEIGFLIDRLTVLMMLVVTFVSLMVHVYTIGYMAEDDGYQRFFAYISLFTFSMLMLVMSNNFLQLFFGWEAVGLVSYLLIGFWFKRPTAIYANLKAFLVNRVGDFGFLLGIGLIFATMGTLNYSEVFAKAPMLKDAIAPVPGFTWNLITAICIGLFIGAMGKSAQFPLHVWLPDSMEGPTPISALIHAATMVTAGIFMVARMSPLFEMSQAALSFVLIIGSITAFFMALIAIVQYDIKRVVAYSTLSQLGYMTMALGAGAYSAGVFHLMTHAFFKAVLFLGAGAVIMAMHHEQDMRKMGGLRKHMPVVYFTVLIGAIANAGLPPFAGFFSKDTIIEAVHASATPGAGIAYIAALAAVFVGALYSFRLVFFTFHGKERWHDVDHAHHDDHHDDHGEHHGLAPGEKPHKLGWVVTLPLILLAIPSIAAGWLIGDVVYGTYFGTAVEKGVIATMAGSFHGVMGMMAHGLVTPPFWLAMAGLGTAFYCYIVKPDLPANIRKKAGALVTILEEKYGFDRFNDWFFAGGARNLGRGLWKFGDVAVIDGFFVNGTAKVIGWGSTVVRKVQTGVVSTYAFAMIIGVFVMLTWLFVRFDPLKLFTQMG
ncbi:MAG: NADH-quinone oxidoreductase subunit L [Burkholderiales bacterium]|nr:NADH-quinone oxidoreductase subunit L [Burkholderiales bacterium]